MFTCESNQIKNMNQFVHTKISQSFQNKNLLNVSIVQSYKKKLKKNKKLKTFYVITRYIIDPIFIFFYFIIIIIFFLKGKHYIEDPK